MANNNTISQVTVNGTTYDLLDANTLDAVSALTTRVANLESSVVKSVTKSGSTITVTKGNGTTNTFTDSDTVYTHPTTAGNKHIPAGGSSGQILRWSAAGTAAWGADNNWVAKIKDIGVKTGTSLYNGWYYADVAHGLTHNNILSFSVLTTTYNVPAFLIVQSETTVRAFSILSNTQVNIRIAYK